MDANSLELMSKVYFWLSDDVSKRIFLSKVDYLITGDKSYIDDMVRTYLPGLPLRNNKEIKDLFDVIPLGRNIVLYGAGEDFVMNAEALTSDSRVVAICDADKDKQNNTICGLMIISPEQLAVDYRECNIIITSHISQNEIRSVLQKKGFSERSIYDLSPYIFCADNGQYFSVDFWKYNEEDGEVFVDDGCCNLQSTILFGKYCRNIRKVYAFEPDEYNYIRCKKEKDKRNLDYVELIKKGHGAKAENCTFLQLAMVHHISRMMELYV